MQLTKQEFLNSINSLLADNSSQQISPQDIRTSYTNLADSVHLFLTDQNIDARNISTPNTRTTVLGVEALDKLSLAGRSSVDNTAVGFRALYQNYDGTDNTVVGAQAASCNLYGDHLVAIGKNALAGNVTGSGNVGIGNFAGQGNKNGDFCIYLGHGAGNYVGQNQDYRLYIGAHAVDWDDLCDSEAASGNIPTIYGDLENHKIAIGINTLHNFGALQSSGDITPVENEGSNVGHGSRQWAQAWLSSGIAYPSSGDFTIGYHSPRGGGFPDQYTITNLITLTGDGKIGIGTETPSGTEGLITVAGNLVPDLHGVRKLGVSGLTWDIYANDIHATGNVVVNDLDYTTRVDYLYEPMTIHLAVSGVGDPFSSGFVNNAVNGYLSDPQLNGAGWMLHSSGVDYQRDYQFIFYEPDQSLACLETDSNYARSHWTSNISLKTVDGRHVQTQRVLGGGNKLSMVTESGCHGVFLRTDESAVSGDYIYFGSQDHVDAYTSSRKNATFYAPSGGQNYFVGIHSVNSGVTLGLDFATTVDSTPSGFSLEYVNRIAGDDTFVIKRNASSKDILTVMESGFVGISNKDSVAVIPQAHLHVQGNTTAEARVSSNGANSSILRVNRQDTSNGVTIKYQGSDNMIDFVAESGNALGGRDKMAFMTIDANTNYVTIGEIYNPTNVRPWRDIAPLAVYHRGEHVSGGGSGTLALAEQEKAPTASVGFGKICVKPKVETGRTQTLIFVDDGGNEFDLTTGGNEDGLHYTEPGSTVVGSGGFGTSSSTKWTTALGVDVFDSGTSITSGVLIGFQNAQYTESTPTGVILIGTRLYRNEDLPNYTLAIGHGDNPVVTGDMNARDIGVQNGSFSVGSANDTTAFSIDHELLDNEYNTVFDVKDNANTSSVSGLLKLNFTDNSDTANTLVTWSHRNSAMSNSPSYVGPPGDARPFMQLEGDVKLRGAILFSDGTYLETANAQTAYGGTGIRRDNVSYGALLHMDYTNLQDYSSLVSSLNTSTSYASISVDDNGTDKITKISLAELGLHITSGTAVLGGNCNLVFTNDNPSINTVANTGTVFVGCNAGASATGWKHTVMMGTEAGKNATTPNVGLATDTASIFIGMRAGKDADNVSNMIAIGTNAGNEARNAGGSIFIGQNAGYNIQVTDSIGIGPEALRGTAGGGPGGDANIEIVAGLLNSQRLMYQKGNLSNRLNIQNTIAGHMGNRRVSIGDGILSPDAPLSVRKDSTIPGHSGTPIQTWYCEDVKVAEVDCDGDFIGIQNPQIIEGFTDNSIPCPSGYNNPTSGIIHVRGEDFVSTTEMYVTHRDPSYTIGSGVLVVAGRVRKEYRPLNIGCSGV